MPRVEVNSIQLFIVLISILAVLWDIYVLRLAKQIPELETTLREIHDLAWSGFAAMLWIIRVQAFGTVFITIAALLRNFYGLPYAIDYLPYFVQIVIVAQYIAFYMIDIMPSTFVFIYIQKIRDVEDEGKRVVRRKWKTDDDEWQDAIEISSSFFVILAAISTLAVFAATFLY